MKPSLDDSVMRASTPTERELASAHQALASSRLEVGALRSEVAALRLALARDHQDTSSIAAADMLEANEHLVLAAVSAATRAETAKSNLADLTQSSQHDALTGTPNRMLMLDRLEKAIALARRQNTHVAVLFVDLDRFKSINDSHGHAAGDEALQLAARRLESAVRESDTVCRVSGDEFIVLLASLSLSAAARVAGKILSALSAPAMVGTHEIALSASIGIAVYPDDGEDAVTLISRADKAMYESKELALGKFRAASRHQESALSAQEQAAESMRAAVVALAKSADDAQRANTVEANQRLVISMLDAQQSGESAAAAHLQQIKFMAMVAHELRDPLAPIKIAAELIARTGADPALITKAQQIIKRQVNQLSRLVEDLLDGSRASTGKFHLLRITIDLVDILNQAVETCRPHTTGRRQTLDFQAPSGPIMLRGDSMRLSQIFVNLLENASKYTDEGGSIRLATDVIDGWVAITVSDNGIGISADVLSAVFDLFVQEPLARARHNGGLGIGLTVVRQLVEAHGGTVTAHSDGKDLGSTFIVRLPIEE